MTTWQAWDRQKRRCLFCACDWDGIWVLYNVPQKISYNIWSFIICTQKWLWQRQINSLSVFFTRIRVFWQGSGKSQSCYNSAICHPLIIVADKQRPPFELRNGSKKTSKRLALKYTYDFLRNGVEWRWFRFKLSISKNLQSVITFF